jgi:hypothetical protein
VCTCFTFVWTPEVQAEGPFPWMVKMIGIVGLFLEMVLATPGR